MMTSFQSKVASAALPCLLLLFAFGHLQAQSCLATSTKRVVIQNSPVADINPSPSNALVPCGGAVTLSTVAGNGYTYQWSKNGSPIAGATNQTYDAASGGEYSVSVNFAPGACDPVTDVATVFENYACNPAFCAASGGNSTKEWIKSVSVAGTTHVSGNNGGYGDFLTSVAPFVLPKGQALTFVLSPEFQSTVYSERWRVWFDFNHDGDFADVGELAFSLAGNTDLTKTYTIPNGKPNGATRMRVAMRRTANPAACGVFPFGEVEDYVVVIGQLANVAASAVAEREETSTVKVADNSTDWVDIQPNPASDWVNLIFSENKTAAGRVQIFNLLGESMFESQVKPGENSLKVKVADWTSGVYLIKTENGESGKIVVQH